MDYGISLLNDGDIYLFKEGTHTRLYEKLGAHVVTQKERRGVYFAVWAPNARAVSVVGDFNGYTPGRHPLRLRNDGSGIWEGFTQEARAGQTYKFHIVGYDGEERQKADPFARRTEKPPASASIICDGPVHDWRDGEWMRQRADFTPHTAPIAIYEVHLASWRRHPDGTPLSYTEAAEALADYAEENGFTHVELMPVTEYPFDGSWGYQVTGYFAPTARFGPPESFMAFVDTLHRRGIGVILDWVPSHFVTDGHGLANFDGTCLFEHQDPRLGYHPQWESAIFNYGRNEVRAFLLSSAHYWMARYHIDAIRVDAVASMLYLDYAREEGEWLPNRYGDNRNLEAADFLKQLNRTLYADFPGIFTVAEESTAYDGVTRPVDAGGLGFGFKWNMGWMHDTLKYFSLDPVYRRGNHNTVTFSLWYAFDENFVLPFSHDEVVHLKGSLFGKMPGDPAFKAANLRAMLAYMAAHPGKKLLFMGNELAQPTEWDYAGSLPWELLKHPLHKGVQNLVADLNRLYREEPALHRYDTRREGFAWLNADDAERNTLVFIRRAEETHAPVLAVCRFAGSAQEGYRIPLPDTTVWEEVFNSRWERYGGDLPQNPRILRPQAVPCCGRPNSALLDMGPLEVALFRAQTPQEGEEKP
ncbi:MAG: 1,4-alpha-glucan branching protein GlgB [Epsilonproteobacteria bacterium]|nr:1,4-alpha-glucan branching protein GlgB [Campylobacterota bacterium]